ncbi:GIY-YIG nuclease family protein [Terasakiella pusilla]|uniref:GIY-YIG nuclease family protein n=1 Tax=Terasakiella pusilla TaxID=64973 RepID=UPI003AA993C1
MSIGAGGKSLELYFIDGNPEGMLTAEVFNWTGHVLKAPRTQVGDALSRSQAGYTGVYLLLGESEGAPLAYIGEAEDISERIRLHDTKKDWWSTAVLVTSAANNLNKAHVKYLEARLIEQASTISRTPLENINAPTRPSLSESAQANMEVFLDYLLMVLPAIGVDIFISKKRPSKNVEEDVGEDERPVFELFARKHGLKATAVLEGGEFVVQAGSLARTKWEGRGSELTSYSQLHAELVRTGILIIDSDRRVFTENYAFKSPSAAAAVVNGRPANGTIEWKLRGTDKTYKEWEADQLSVPSETV